MTAVVQISTTVNCVSRPRSKTMKKKRIAQNEDPGMSAMAVGKDTKTSVIPEETTSFIAEFDCLKIIVLETVLEMYILHYLAMNPSTLKITNPPKIDVKEFTKQIISESFRLSFLNGENEESVIIPP